MAGGFGVRENEDVLVSRGYGRFVALARKKKIHDGRALKLHGTCDSNTLTFFFIKKFPSQKPRDTRNSSEGPGYRSTDPHEK